jgi:hypothetical protein
MHGHTPWEYIVYWAERRLLAGGSFVGCSSWEFRFRTGPNECHIQSGWPGVSFFASFHLLPPTGFRIIGSQIMNGRTVRPRKKLYVKTNRELQGNLDGWGVLLPCCSAATVPDYFSMPLDVSIQRYGSNILYIEVDSIWPEYHAQLMLDGDASMVQATLQKWTANSSGIQMVAHSETRYKNSQNLVCRMQISAHYDEFSKIFSNQLESNLSCLGFNRNTTKPPRNGRRVR